MHHYLVSFFSLVFLIASFTPAHAGHWQPSNSKVAKQLRVCKKHFDANRLTTGKGGTALVCYGKVLKKDPTNADALKGLENIEARYQFWINKARNKGQRKKAKRYQARLRQVAALKAKLQTTDVSPSLQTCQAHLKAYRLTTGRSGNALACYGEVLKKDPTNAQALDGLEKIEARYKSLINKALDRGQPKKVKRYQAGLDKVAALKATLQPKTAGKHALLIGIEKYRYPVTPLRGTINDIKLVQGVLRERFGFRDHEFIILLNKRATHTGIEKAFKTLTKRIKPGDFVYIHYSGHGSQTRDLNGDERSGKDQTWVSYGTRRNRKTHKNDYDILDDEINAWLAAIYAKTDQVIFVSDSCHSATVARGEAPISRGLKKDERPHPLGKMNYTQLDKYHGIHVGAAQNDELAAETIGKDGKHYGLFTWYWAKALRQAQVGETWYDIFKRAYTPVVGKRGQAQTPQIEGEHKRQVFGGNFTSQAQTISVTQANGKTVKIQAGHVAGVTIGSTYRLYQPQHPNPQKLQSLQITQVKAFESIGKTTQAGLFKPGDLVVEESHAYHFEPIKVYLSADYSKDKALLRTAFHDGTLPGYKLTDNPYNTDLRLHLLRPKRKNGQPIASPNDDLPKSFPNQPPELWILTPDQRLLDKKLQIKFDNPKKGIELLQDNLKKLARIRELKALQNNRSNILPVTMQTYLLRPVKSCPRWADCVSLSAFKLGLHRKTGPYELQEIEKRKLRKGDILTFTLHNDSEQDYYCYLISINSNGAIYAFFPHPDEGMAYALVKAGEKLDLSEDALLMMEEVGETIKIIVSIHPIDVSLFGQEEFRVRGGSGNEKLNPLERLLTNATHGERGLTRVSEHDEWATGLVTLEVK
ncbi:MAG: caspase family protein [Pseudomonadota bacterium]